MKLVIFTTQTPHHTYFVNELNKVYKINTVVLETEGARAPFNTTAKFEKKIVNYEINEWFAGNNVQISDIVKTYSTPDINSTTTIDKLKQLSPDLTIVFGARKLSRSLIEVCGYGRIINLHGGNPEKYRGLDSLYWSIYHNDFSELVTTLHQINTELDDGDIIRISKIPIIKEMELYELRRFNTELCVKMVISALTDFLRFGHFISKPQSEKGRYYSFMPSCLKEICCKKFKKFTEKL